jgi:hypothetical protein
MDIPEETVERHDIPRLYMANLADRAGQYRLWPFKIMSSTITHYDIIPFIESSYITHRY